MGRGGEMAEFASDYLPPTLDEVVSAADVAMLRPPSTLWGYNVQVTDEALSRIAQVVTERDVEIAVLRQQLADLRSATGPQHLARPGSGQGALPEQPEQPTAGSDAGLDIASPDSAPLDDADQPSGSADDLLREGTSASRDE